MVDTPTTPVGTILWQDTVDAFNWISDQVQSSLQIVGVSDTNNSLKNQDNTLDQNKYDLTQRVFPSNLGEFSYNSHYIIININVSNYSQFTGTVNGPAGEVQVDTKSNELSKVDALRSSIDNQWSTAGGSPIGVGWYVPRQTRRIVESIALFEKD